MAGEDQDWLDAHRENLTEQESALLSKSPNFRVRIALSRNPSLGRVATRFLLRDYQSIALNTIRNPSVDVGEVQTFLMDEFAKNHAFISDRLLTGRDQQLIYVFWQVCNQMRADTPVFNYFSLVNPEHYWQDYGFPFVWGRGRYGDNV